MLKHHIHDFFRFRAVGFRFSVEYAVVDENIVYADAYFVCCGRREGDQIVVVEVFVGEGNQLVDEPILVEGQEYRMTCVSMGNPHAVVFMDNVADLDIESVGPFFENHERFPRRTNTEFVKVIDRKTLEMRVWERGTGETLACGTGACATAVAAMLNGLTEDNVTVKLLGGDLQIQWDREANVVNMTGPAVIVFEGSFILP